MWLWYTVVIITLIPHTSAIKSSFAESSFLLDPFTHILSLEWTRPHNSFTGEDCGQVTGEDCRGIRGEDCGQVTVYEKFFGPELNVTPGEGEGNFYNCSYFIREHKEFIDANIDITSFKAKQFRSYRVCIKVVGEEACTRRFSIETEIPRRRRKKKHPFIETRFNLDSYTHQLSLQWTRKSAGVEASCVHLELFEKFLGPQKLLTSSEEESYSCEYTSKDGMDFINANIDMASYKVRQFRSYTVCARLEDGEGEEKACTRSFSVETVVPYKQETEHNYEGSNAINRNTNGDQPDDSLEIKSFTQNNSNTEYTPSLSFLKDFSSYTGNETEIQNREKKKKDPFLETKFHLDLYTHQLSLEWTRETAEIQASCVNLELFEKFLGPQKLLTSSEEESYSCEYTSKDGMDFITANIDMASYKVRQFRSYTVCARLEEGEGEGGEKACTRSFSVETVVPYKLDKEPNYEGSSLTNSNGDEDKYDDSLEIKPLTQVSSDTESTPNEIEDEDSGTKFTPISNDGTLTVPGIDRDGDQYEKSEEIKPLTQNISKFESGPIEFEEDLNISTGDNFNEGTEKDSIQFKLLSLNENSLQNFTINTFEKVGGDINYENVINVNEESKATKELPLNVEELDILIHHHKVQQLSQNNISEKEGNFTTFENESSQAKRKDISDIVEVLEKQVKKEVLTDTLDKSSTQNMYANIYLVFVFMVIFLLYQR